MTRTKIDERYARDVRELAMRDPNTLYARGVITHRVDASGRPIPGTTLIPPTANALDAANALAMDPDAQDDRDAPAAWWPPKTGTLVLHADGDAREVVGVFEHDDETRIVTAHRFSRERDSRYVYETFWKYAMECGLLRLKP